MLRFVLALIVLLSLGAAYMFLVSPDALSMVYAASPTDGFSLFLAMSRGAAFLAIAVSAAFTFVRPGNQRSTVVLLLVIHFTFFLVDVVVLARGILPVRSLLPEMIYFIIVCGALVRAFPVAAKARNQESGIQNQE